MVTRFRIAGFPRVLGVRIAIARARPLSTNRRAAARRLFASVGVAHSGTTRTAPSGPTRSRARRSARWR